jgi:hypothetical protein
MNRTRTLILAALATLAVLAGAAPAANASAWPSYKLPSYSPASFSPSYSPRYSPIPSFGGAGLPSFGGGGSPCGTSAGHDGQGGTAGTQTIVCMGSGLVFIGPSTGQIANVIGPTIIGSNVGTVVVSAGNGAAFGGGY